MPAATKFAGLSDADLARAKRDLLARRRAIDRRGAFALFTPKRFQRPWYASEKQIRALFAANQVGKTTYGVITTVSAATGTKPISLGGTIPEHWEDIDRKGKLFLIVAESFQTAISKTIVPKLREYLTDDMIADQKNQPTSKVPNWYKLKSGAEIHIMSYDQDLGGFEGPVWDGVWLDEPPPQPIFNAIWRGVLARSGWIVITATPLKEPWMHDTIVEPAETPGDPMEKICDVFAAEMHDNCLECCGGALPHDQIQAYLSKLPPKEREARQYGLFLNLQGREFPYVTRDTHVVPDFW